MNVHVDIGGVGIRFAVTGGILFITMCLNIRGVNIVGAASAVFAAIALSPFILMSLYGVQFIRWEYITASNHHPNWSAFLPVMLWSLNGWDGVGNVAANVQASSSDASMRD